MEREVKAGERVERDEAKAKEKKNDWKALLGVAREDAEITENNEGGREWRRKER